MRYSASDEQILAAIPAYLCLPGLLKASPVQEDGERFLYIEASTETPDRQGEVILQKALVDSQDFYLRHGNIDLQHFTMLGPKQGISNYMEFEIGKPTAVKIDGPRTFVKAHLYSGDSAMARHADMVWDSLTKQSPAARWYPSVGGSVLSKSIRIDPTTKERVAVVDKVRWSNIGLTRTPVNVDVPEVSTAPIGIFAKSLDAIVMVKSLTAGYGTDSASLSGGGAMRKQSLYGAKGGGTINYFDIRERLAGDLKSGAVASPSSATIKNHLTAKYGLSDGDAHECVDRFMRDLHAAQMRSRK
jgi:hypothetical protein